MKVLAALATLAIVAAFGATQLHAAERIAKLTDPETTGAMAFAPLGALEKASLPAAVARTGLSGLELKRIRSSIRGHIQALSEHDASGAYDRLTPAIQEFYGNSDAFLTYLTEQIKPLVNVKIFAFTSIEREAADAIQEVVLTSTKDREWIARFHLERQSDGRWAIMGCKVEEAAGHQS
jgi:hypothetical protein